MQSSMRTFVVGLLVLFMSFNPATAYRFSGGCYSGCGSYGPVYYSYHGGCCSETVVYEQCGDCQPCGGCDPCDSAVRDAAPTAPSEMPAPSPAKLPPAPQPQQPATVDRPVEPTPTYVPPQPPPVEPLPTAPAEPAPSEQPDDLFNSTEDTTTTPPAETPAEDPDDLFGTPSEPAETAPPAETTPPAEAPAEEPDDLFGSPAETAPTESAPAESTEEAPAEMPAEEETPAEDEDDIFGASRGILREAGGLASEDVRLWTDNTGNFSCRGRMLRFINGQVRLLKDNGRTTTVPLNRLSAGDLEFVHRQARAQQAEAFQTAQSRSALPLLAN